MPSAWGLTAGLSPPSTSGAGWHFGWHTARKRAKARVGRARKTRVDLEQQLKACRREIAHARERLVEATKQQTATSEMLRIISSSPSEIQSVLDAVAENAARLCDANNAEDLPPGGQPSSAGSFIRGNSGDYPCLRGRSRKPRHGDRTSRMRSSDDSCP